MKVKLDGEVLSSYIKSIQKMVQATTISVEVGKNFASVIGVGNGNSCSMSIPCEVLDKKGEAAFSIDANVLLTSVAKRKELSFAITDSAVKVTSGKYEAELLCHQYEKIVVIPEEAKADKSLKLKDKFLQSLRVNLPKVELKPLLSLYDYIPIGVKATKEGTFVACFDAYQSAFYFDKELTGNLEFTLPSNIFMTIAREIKDQDYALIITDSTVYAYNDNFELAMGLVQQDGQQVTLDDMLGLYAGIKKEKGGQRLQMKAEGVKGLLSNAKAVYEKDSTFTFETEGKKCKLHLQSSYGQIKSVVLLDEEPSSPVKFSCDFNFFSTLLDKAPATLDLRVNERMMMFRNGSVTYLLSLV